MKNSALLLLALLVVACESGPPAKSASGERIESVKIEEKFARSDEVKMTEFTGERLHAVLEMMDKKGVTGLTGSFESKAVVASGTITIIVKPVEKQERRIDVKSCKHAEVCSFVEQLYERKLMEHVPVACKSEAKCD